MYSQSHCLLIICDDTELCLLDPYESTDVTELDTYQNHMKLLIAMKQVYFDQMHNIHNLNIPSYRMTVLMPPKVPRLRNAEDCGVFLLMFIKFSILSWTFEFSGDNIITSNSCKLASFSRDIIKSNIEVTNSSIKLFETIRAENYYH